jgi:hypothetical protein
MRFHRWFANCLPTLLAGCALWAASAAQAQYFRDDFEDGSVTDGSPVTWVTEVPDFPEGDYRVENGSFILTPRPSEFFADYWETDWEVERELPADVVVRTQVRALTNVAPGFSYQGIYARDTHNVNARQGNAVGALVTSNGYVAILRVADGEGTHVTHRTIPELSSLKDIHLELRLSGIEATLYAWPDGSPRPTTPTLFVRSVGGIYDTPGRVGVYAGQQDDTPLVASAFRFFEASPIPEPSTLGLLGLAAAGGMRRNSRRRLPSAR